MFSFFIISLPIFSVRRPYENVPQLLNRLLVQHKVKPVPIKENAESDRVLNEQMFIEYLLALQEHPCNKVKNKSILEFFSSEREQDFLRRYCEGDFLPEKTYSRKKLFEDSMYSQKCKKAITMLKILYRECSRST